MRVEVSASSVIDSGIKCTLIKIAGDTKLNIMLDMPEGPDAIQNVLDKLEKWPPVNPNRVNKTKCKVM